MTGLFGLGGVTVAKELSQVVAFMLDRACVTDKLTCNAITQGAGVAGGWVGPAWQAEPSRVWVDPSGAQLADAQTNARMIVWFDGELYNSGQLANEPVGDVPAAQKIAAAYNRAGRLGETLQWLTMA